MKVFENARTPFCRCTQKIQEVRDLNWWCWIEGFPGALCSSMGKHAGGTRVVLLDTRLGGELVGLSWRNNVLTAARRARPHPASASP